MLMLHPIICQWSDWWVPCFYAYKNSCMNRSGLQEDLFFKLSMIPAQSTLFKVQETAEHSLTVTHPLSFLGGFLFSRFIYKPKDTLHDRNGRYCSSFSPGLRRLASIQCFNINYYEQKGHKNDCKCCQLKLLERKPESTQEIAKAVKSNIQSFFFNLNRHCVNSAMCNLPQTKLISASFDSLFCNDGIPQ